MSDEFKKLLGGRIKKIQDQNQSEDFTTNNGRSNRDRRYASEHTAAPNPIANDTIAAEDFIEFRRQGVQISMVDKMASGDMRPNEIIDLHGMNLLEAEIYMRETISTMDFPTMSCLKVIHGKGYSQDPTESGNMPARMKNFVADYLITHPRVLAYVSTPIEHGGAGALYVLIKKIS